MILFFYCIPGLYLFVQVIAAFSFDNTRLKLRHYIFIGWGETQGGKNIDMFPNAVLKDFFVFSCVLLLLQLPLTQSQCHE